MNHHHTFTEWLHAQREGAAHAELTSKLAELVQQVVEYQGAGELTLKLKVSLVPGTGRQLLVGDEITVKPPKMPKHRSIFFHDPEGGGLSRKDPLQTELPLVELDSRRVVRDLEEEKEVQDVG